MNRIVGAVTVSEVDDPEAAMDSKLKLIGTIDDVIDIVDRYRVRQVYLAIPLDATPRLESIYFRLLDRNVDVHWAPNIFGMTLINHSLRDLAGLPVLTLSETPLTGINRLQKDIEDKLLSILFLLFWSPVMIATAIAIKLDSPGPVFFRQPRTGWDGREFRIWKFRSMVVHDVHDGVVKQAERGDARITRVGAFIRKTSIDELPQLFNVLIGDMSLVGPRPHAVEHNDDYSQKITGYLARHRIKPGMTGLAQVRGYRGETKDVDLMAKRVEYDIEYINNWSVGLDLTIIAETALVVFRQEAY
jgi:putative colanic acid biosynthesis UDP-glucose lipid carrier transferase